MGDPKHHTRADGARKSAMKPPTGTCLRKRTPSTGPADSQSLASESVGDSRSPRARADECRVMMVGSEVTHADSSRPAWGRAQPTLGAACVTCEAPHSARAARAWRTRCALPRSSAPRRARGRRYVDPHRAKCLRRAGVFLKLAVSATDLSAQQESTFPSACSEHSPGVSHREARDHLDHRRTSRTGRAHPCRTLTGEHPLHADRRGLQRALRKRTKTARKPRACPS
jgi:hypothetical protein